MKQLLGIFAVIGTFGLTGCDENGNLGREGSPAWHNRTSAAEKSAYFGKGCSSYGFKSGTPEMAQCIGKKLGSLWQMAAREWLPFLINPTRA